jgi:DNA-directed RNA polymerase subunit RPC12/RpoP
MAEVTEENLKNSICGQCGESIVEPWDDEQRKPCPKCGSLTRRIVVEQRVQVENIETVTATTTAQIEIVASHPRILLDLAGKLIEEGKCGIAIVVAHMACELATEQSLSDAFARKGLGYLQRSVTGLLNGYNLANRNNRRLYTALTGDAVQDTPFWTSFKESAGRRNGIVHGGGAKIVPKSDAEKSYKAANELLVHLGYGI